MGEHSGSLRAAARGIALSLVKFQAAVGYATIPFHPIFNNFKEV